MSVILYTAPGCGPCSATKRALQAMQIKHEVIDLSTDPEALEFVTKTLGYQRAPVVYLDAEQHWTGFDMEKLTAMKVNRDPASLA